ncbi:unnamed protein product [Lactuca saligna]|uniref:Ubiquitin-like protease family profile domain-containing protein n=1 Tax=Lactuca saligna TaxID=75948 RepID=A0AA35V4A8_LACSI|nr:unnamed protein product [Lactuca saligna]
MLSFITAIANKLLRYTMDDQPQQPPQPQERKKRIATQLIDSQEPQEVDFNHFGMHYGDKQIKFANECGVLTRSIISINYRTWKKVPQGELEIRWNIQNNKRRGDVLKICNTAWKSYKKRRIHDFMANGRDPIPIYPYLDPDTWKTFKKERSSKEFRAISEKARANAKLQKNPARLGPHGYRVLGREHPGRTRAVGHTVGLRKAMQGNDKKKRKMHVKESMNEMRATIDDLTKQVAEVVEVKEMMHESNKQVVDNVSPGVLNSSCDSMPALVEITNPTQCKLVLPYGALDQNCASGLVFPYGNGLIHSLPLRENYLKVLIDKINKDFQGLSIPVVTDEASNLQSAVGQIIQWPRNAIILTEIQGRKLQNSTPSSLQTTVGGCTKKNTLTPMNKSKPIELLRERLKNNPLIHVVADYGILEAEKFEFWIAREEILRLLNKRTLDVTILTVWQMNQHPISRLKNKCSFLNPHRILGADCQENLEAIINYIVDAMRINQGKQFLIAPYLQSEHWVLFVISPHNRTGYILDSIRSPIQKPMDTYYLLKKHVDSAFARYGKDASNPINWTLAECNQQPGDWECGYYVMKWMTNFVMVEQNGFLSRTATPWNDTTPFSETTLFSTVVKWATQFLNKYMKDVVGQKGISS